MLSERRRGRPLQRSVTQFPTQTSTENMPSAMLATSRIVYTARSWPEVGLGLIPADPGAFTQRDVPAPADPYRFFVIEAIKPLSP